MKQAAEELGVDLEWGGDWRTFKDGPHWQLAWDTYPKGDMKSRIKAKPETVDRDAMVIALLDQAKALLV